MKQITSAHRGKLIMIVPQDQVCGERNRNIAMVSRTTAITIKVIIVRFLDRLDFFIVISPLKNIERTDFTQYCSDTTWALQAHSFYQISQITPTIKIGDQV